MSQRSALSAEQRLPARARLQPRRRRVRGRFGRQENRADGEEDSIYLSGSSRQPTWGRRYRSVGGGATRRASAARRV